MANGLAAALFAPACAVCDAVLEEPLSGCVCASCWRSIRPITPPICDACGNPLPKPDTPCLACREHVGPIAKGRAVGEYEGALREIIHALKYDRRRSVSRPLADLMRRRGRDVVSNADFAVPVPLHWRRQYQRGFNQASELARQLGPPMIELLVRTRRTRPQVELAANRRQVNVDGAFKVRRRFRRARAFAGARVLLVDDVSTTGATLNACARVLKDAGAREVLALTAAKVITRRHNGSTNPESLTQSPIPNPQSLIPNP